MKDTSSMTAWLYLAEMHINESGDQEVQADR